MYDTVSKQEWKSEVWAAGKMVFIHSGFLYHYVEIVPTADTVAVFGGHRDGLYLEVFSRSDGDPVCRFSTGYLGYESDRN